MQVSHIFFALLAFVASPTLSQSIRYSTECCGMVCGVKYNGCLTIAQATLAGQCTQTTEDAMEWSSQADRLSMDCYKIQTKCYALCKEGIMDIEDREF